MPRKIYTPEQIIRNLREAEVLIAEGMTARNAARQIGVTEQTYYRWRKEYGGMKVDQAKKYKNAPEVYFRFNIIVYKQLNCSQIVQFAPPIKSH